MYDLRYDSSPSASKQAPGVGLSRSRLEWQATIRPRKGGPGERLSKYRDCGPRNVDYSGHQGQDVPLLG